MIPDPLTGTTIAPMHTFANTAASGGLACST
jgi:hypothetical protein